MGRQPAAPPAKPRPVTAAQAHREERPLVMQIIQQSAAQAAEARAARELMAAYAFVADGWPDWEPEAAAAQIMEGMDPQARVWAALDGGRWQWLAVEEELAFDSRIFGRSLCRIWPIAHREPWPEPQALTQGKGLLAEQVQAAAARGIEGLVARVPARDMLAAQALEATGYRLVDVSVEWMLTLEGLPDKAASLQGAVVRAWRPGEQNQLAELAAASFCDLHGYADRFAMDPRLRGQCPELYRRWLANSLDGEQADQVLVLEREGEVLGFITLKLPAGGPAPAADTGWVVLNAIAPAERGQGLYHGLLQRGLAWLAKHRVAKARVRTKLSQPAVIRAWAALGGRQVHADLTFHNWLD